MTEFPCETSEDTFYNLCLKSWFFFCFLISTTLSVAQPPISFKQYTVSDGLSHNTVWDVLQDSVGFAWIATDDGLNKFDGLTFQKYLHTPVNGNNINNHPIRALAEDQYHNIWIGTWGGGILVYNQEQDQFRHITDSEDESYPDLSFVYTIHYGSQGDMWVGTSGGLAQFNVEDYSLIQYQHDSTNSTSLSNNRVLAITEDHIGNLWIGTLGGGLNYFDVKSGTFEHITHQAGNPRSLSHNDIYSILYDSQQRLWVGTWDSGLNLMHGETKEFTRFRHRQGDLSSISNDQVWSIAEDASGRIWVGTDNGLSLFNEEDSTFSVYRHDSFDPKSLSANSVKCILADHYGQMWVGTYDGGVNLYNPSVNQIQHYYQKQGQSSLSGNNVSAVVQLDQDRVLIGTDGNGLNLFDKSSGQFTNFTCQPDNPTGIGGDKIKTLLLDQEGKVWIGFWNNGMDRFDPETNSFIHFRKDERESSPWLTSDNVTSLVEDQDGLLWVGTFGGGLYSFDPQQNLFASYIKYPNGGESISDRNIWSVLVDRNNNIWFGTSNGRVTLLDRQQNRFIQVLPRQPSEEGYAILTLFEDHQGRVWAGLEGGGLQLLDRQNNAYPAYTVEAGLPSNIVKSIEESADGYLWLGTTQGLVRFDPDSLSYKRYTVGDGLQGLYFNQDAAARLSSGELVFGGTEGFNLFHPDSLQERSQKSPIAFTDFEIFNRPVPVGEEDSPLNKQINYTESINLSYKYSVFSISYTSINFSSPNLIRYRYRLLGFTDDSWQRVGSERKVTYTNLQPGQYTFEVRGQLSDQMTPTRSIAIIVTPPWWRTWWFYIITGGTFLILLYAVYWIRAQQIIRANRKLGALVDERTSKLQQANQELQKKNVLIQDQKEEIQTQAEELIASNEEIRSINQRLEDTVEMRTADLQKSNEELDNFVYRVSHDIRAPLSSVLGLLELMGLDQSYEQLNIYREMAAKSINKLDGFVKNILDYSRNSRLQPKHQQVDFHLLLDDLLEDLQYMKNAQKLQVIREIDGENIYRGDPMRLQVIFRNLLSNAIKYQNPYAKNPFVKVQVEIKPSEAIITVEDNGIGIKDEQVQRVFEMFYRADDQEAGSGIGLYIVKETIDKLGGSITISSQVEKGTTFTVKLPNRVTG